MAGERLYLITASAVNAIYNASTSAVTYTLPTGGTGLYRMYVPNTCNVTFSTASASFATAVASASASNQYNPGAVLVSASGCDKFAVLGQNAGTFTLNIVAFASAI